MAGGFQKLRDGLALTQQDLADYLGELRSLIAQVETNRRVPSTASGIKLAQLELAAISVATEETAGVEPLQQEKIRAAMAKRAAACALSAERLRRKLARAEKVLQSNRRKVLTMNALQKTAPPEDRATHLWIELQLQLAAMRLKDERLIEVAEMKLTLELLLIEAEKAAALAQNV